MLKEYQITLIDKSGMYRPVSCLLKRDDAEIETIGCIPLLSYLLGISFHSLMGERTTM